MKKKLFATTITLCSFFLSSCSNNDDGGLIIKNDLKKNNLKLNIEFVKSSTGSNLSNVQVGDTLTFKYKIEYDTIPTKNFIITPKITDPEKHQTVGEDYEIIINNKIATSITTKEKEGTFKYLVKKPGNFDNYFTVAHDTLISNECNVFFNAVKIIAYTYTIQLKHGTTFGGHSINNYYSKLFIDTGNKKNDNYLSGLDYVAKFLHLEREFKNFEKNKSFDFYKPQRYRGTKLPSIRPTEINNLIFKFKKYSTETTIEYKNIPVRFMARQQLWGENGNNNF